MGLGFRHPRSVSRSKVTIIDDECSKTPGKKVSRRGWDDTSHNGEDSTRQKTPLDTGNPIKEIVI